MTRQDVHTIMRGPTLLRLKMAAFMAVAVPQLIDVAREQWPVTEWELPYPKMYDADDPYAVPSGQWPALAWIVSNDNNHNRMDNSGSAENEYFIKTQWRLAIIVSSPRDESPGEFLLPEHSQALRLRDDLTSICKAAMLGTPSFGDPDNIRLDEDTLVTDYLEPVALKTEGRRWITQTILSFTVGFREWTHELPYGTDGLDTQLRLQIERLARA